MQVKRVLDRRLNEPLEEKIFNWYPSIDRYITKSYLLKKYVKSRTIVDTYDVSWRFYK